MSDTKHGEAKAELDLRNSPGDEPVWTAGTLEEIETVRPESAQSDEAPRLEGLDLRDSPGDEPVHSFADPTDPVGDRPGCRRRPGPIRLPRRGPDASAGTPRRRRASPPAGGSRWPSG